MAAFGRVAIAYGTVFALAVLVLLPAGSSVSPVLTTHSPLAASPLELHVSPVPAVRSVRATGIAISTVNYSSSVDGFPLSYSEVLPAGYVASDRDPLLVELHGISVSNSAPHPGGYPTPLDNLTMNDTSAMGFILIVPNTRTGDGFYIDSQYTGPQAQDILDAIAHEKALRLVGSVYLYGFSMGSMGTLSIGLLHPGLFAGLGSIATFSDIYELYEYQASHSAVPLNDALLNLTGGELPNASAYAADIFNELTELRLHPELTRGLRMYLVSGGRDSLAPDNPALWPYLEGNNSAIQTTCLVASAIAEPQNCTDPLAALHATDPTNYSYRFVYEANGQHAYEQLNVTDMLEFFLGEVPDGPYVGTFPIPTVTASPQPLVTFATQPSSCGTVSWNGVPYPNGFTVPVPPGAYDVAASACPGYTFHALLGRDGVTWDAASGSATVTTSGAIVAEFVPVGGGTNATVHYRIVVSASNGCPAATLNGSAVADGTYVDLLPGEYVAAAAPCPGWVFASWSASGGLVVWSPTASVTGVAVTGNGTLVAGYVEATATVPVTVLVEPAGCGPIFLNDSAAPNGSVASLLPGTYALVAPDCAGYRFSGWSTSAGVYVAASGSVTTLSVTSSGYLNAVYSASVPSIFEVRVVVVPATCGPSVSIAGALYANGTEAQLPVGAYALVASSCPAHQFQSWATTGDVDAAGTTLTVNGNGTLSASFAPTGGTGGGPNGTNNASTPPPPPAWEFAILAAVIGAGAGSLVAWVLRGRRSTPGRGGP